jgi:outer membrane protein OmpA-like peptidoglycan-associated protein
MRRPLLIAAICFILAGCASSSTRVSLLTGEKNELGEQSETGAVVVLDPGSDQDIRVISEANSRSGVKGSSVAIKSVTPGALEAKYGDLLTTLPRKPKTILLYFKPNSLDLVDPSKIDEVKREINSREGADIQIVGHTDTTGDEPLNDKVSFDRAEAVKTLLAAQGIDVNIVRTSGRGERELRVPTANDVANDENRRVEITVR